MPIWKLDDIQVSVRVDSTMLKLAGTVLSWIIDIFRKCHSRKPILNIYGQKQSDFLQIHQELHLGLKNNDEAYAIKLETVCISEKSSLSLKISRETARCSSVYAETSAPFSSTVSPDLTIPPGTEIFFMISFSSSVKRYDTHDSIVLKVYPTRPQSSHKTTKPIIFRIAVDDKMEARIQ